MEPREFIVTAFTENSIGVLNRITATYLRRKINIESLRVSESSIKGISMFIISAITTEDIIDKVCKQIMKIVEVHHAEYYTEEQLITQEIALFKLSKSLLDTTTGASIVSRIGARIIEIGADYIVLEMTGSGDDVKAFAEEMTSAGVLLQYSSSGSVILHRNNIEEFIQHNQSNEL